MVERSFESTLPPRTARTWVQAVRPFTFAASIVPVLLGAAVAAGQGMFNPVLLVLTLGAATAVQGSANLFSDYLDDRGGSSENFFGGLVLMAAAAALGLYLALLRGPAILLLGGLGALGASVYSRPPAARKYRAWGDLVAFLVFGPLTVLGAYYVQARAIELVPMLYSLPVGCLITAVVRVNNLRSVPSDGQSRGTTAAGPPGMGGARVMLSLLLATAYLLVIAGALVGTFVRGAALALLSAPLAWALGRQVRQAAVFRDLALIDAETARLHLVFGVLLIIGVLL